MSSSNSCLQDKDQIARSLTEKLLVFATGHKMEFADRDTVEKIVAALPVEEIRFPHPDPRSRQSVTCSEINNCLQSSRRK